ncbi:MAG TPA: malto-oligosyltrehalose synthase [Microlunatus sp.]|nr:malto-oligosyltrehalose synthase [Microlunatus sp.]
MPAPTSTYRLQITDDFTLTDAAAVVPYLARLGVGAVYLSPILQSSTGSTHGYDTTDVSRIDAGRGGEAGFAALRAAADEHGLGVVVDIVPNHLGIAEPRENPYWWDVLRRGQDSAYASWFDIDWSRPRILLPVLGDDPELSVVDGELRYFDHGFPLADGTWAPGDTAEEVHARQHYELVHWSRGDSELNYRRFFAVTTLAGVRVEDPAVFDATQALPLEWARTGVSGLRIDHPDGLVDPAGYLQRLAAGAPDAWITVEKILEPGEELPAWPVAGTTGYDAMREVGGLFVDRDAEAELTALYQGVTGDTRTIAEHIEIGKRMVVDQLLVAEVRRIAALAPDVPHAGAAVAEIAVAFDVYRSYLPEGAERLDAAIRLAAERRPALRGALDRLSGRLHDSDDEVARRMQQLSGATMAKGVEDTAFYRYARFVALNEVGGDPGEFGIALPDFHALQHARQATWPQTMTGLSTHDTKRGEDVRARLAVLAEVPAAWAEFAGAFLAASEIPNRPFAYFVAQTLVGVGPVERERLHAYVEKAMREAALETRWTSVNEVYEATVHGAVDRAYDDPPLRAAWESLVATVAAPGWSNALGQKLVQLTMPGIPDVYQGTEVWEDSLVDPDNRRPVDYAAHAGLLAEVLAGNRTAPAVDATGAAKLLLTATALRLRRERSELFAGYTPVSAAGPATEHVVAFDRGGLVAVATRLPIALEARGGWAGTDLALEGNWTDQLTGRTYDGPVPLVELLSSYPVALLTR